MPKSTRLTVRGEGSVQVRCAYFVAAALGEGPRLEQLSDVIHAVLFVAFFESGVSLARGPQNFGGRQFVSEAVVRQLREHGNQYSPH
jgi:hypothetical protein